MKNQIIYILILFSGITYFIPEGKAQSANNKSVEATFIGGHGYLLESHSKKVMLDAVIYWEGYNWGYIKPPLVVKEEIENAREPFDSIDLIFVSHAHTDHYNPQMIEKSMLKNKNAALIVTQEVYDAIEANADSLAEYNDRIWIPDLNFYQSIDTTVNEIPVTITEIPHGQENMELLVFSFLLDSIRFLQLNSWNSITSEMYDTLGFNKKRADVCFLGYD